MTCSQWSEVCQGEIKSAGKDMETLNPLAGRQNVSITVQNGLAVPQKAKHKLTL